MYIAHFQKFKYIMSTFAALGIKKPFIQSIKELGINTPSEIQQKAIPILLDKRTDFVG